MNNRISFLKRAVLVDHISPGWTRHYVYLVLLFSPSFVALDIGFDSASSHCVGRHLSQLPAWARGVTILHYSISGCLSWFQIFIWPPVSFNHRLWKNSFTVCLMLGCLTWYFLWPPSPSTIIERWFPFDVDNFQTIYQVNAAERKFKFFMRLFIFMSFKVVRL